VKSDSSSTKQNLLFSCLTSHSRRKTPPPRASVHCPRRRTPEELPDGARLYINMVVRPHTDKEHNKQLQLLKTSRKDFQPIVQRAVS
jgi:hypothetical protein